jgi:hypothetical protein
METTVVVDLHFEQVVMKDGIKVVLTSENRQAQAIRHSLADLEGGTSP